MNKPDGKNFYGSVTVGERGQIVIPVNARKDFGIKPGDKLLVFGDMEKGLGIATLDIMQRTMAGTLDLFQEIGQQIRPEDKEKTGR